VLNDKKKIENAAIKSVAIPIATLAFHAIVKIERQIGMECG